MITYQSLLLCCLVSFAATRAFAYEISTHFDLSKASAKLAISDNTLQSLGLDPKVANQTFPTEGGAAINNLDVGRAPTDAPNVGCNPGLSYTSIDIVACGAMFEDDSLRSLNHFMDPQHLVGGKPRPLNSFAATILGHPVGYRRRADAADADGDGLVGAAGVVVRDGVRRDQHDPPDRLRHRRRRLRRHRRIGRLGRGSDGGVPVRLVGHGGDHRGRPDPAGSAAAEARRCSRGTRANRAGSNIRLSPERGNHGGVKRYLAISHPIPEPYRSKSYP